MDYEARFEVHKSDRMMISNLHMCTPETQF